MDQKNRSHQAPIKTQGGNERQNEGQQGGQSDKQRGGQQQIGERKDDRTGVGQGGRDKEDHNVSR